jgi:class 3 adenylate cyclase/pimeloyl-ACP methyl ester carboxylesterase
LEWQIPQWRLWYERLAEKRMVIRYDPRGCGLSQRDVTDYSLEAHVRDLEAVVDRLGLGSFMLVGAVQTGPPAITYAVRHPERVSHLILWCTFARGSDYVRSPALEAVRAMLDKDFEVFTETAARVAFGWPAGEEASRFAAFLRECTTPEAYRAALRATSQFDATAQLAQVQAPTLVLHRRQVPFPVVDLASDLAARIPDARLVVLEGTTIAPWPGMELALGAIESFLGEGEPSMGPAAPPEAGAFRTVFFTDLVGHTEMMSRLGDERGRAVLREHERITREVLKAHGGTEVKTLGDGFMASFGSVTKAVECAIALQRAFDERNTTPGVRFQPDRGGAGRSTPVEPLHIRVGLNAGEPIEEDGDLFGATVILAARIAAKAEGGEILVANAVRELCSGKGFLFADRGEFVAKGFEEPVRVFEVRWGE